MRRGLPHVAPTGAHDRRGQSSTGQIKRISLDLPYSHHDNNHPTTAGARVQRGISNQKSSSGSTASGVAAGAVGGFIADGVSGGQHATRLAKGKSRRWRDGGSGTHKASARPFALWRGSVSDAVARGGAQAGERFFAGLRRAAPWAVQGLAAVQSASA